MVIGPRYTISKFGYECHLLLYYWFCVWRHTNLTAPVCVCVCCMMRCAQVCLAGITMAYIVHSRGQSTNTWPITKCHSIREMNHRNDGRNSRQTYQCAQPNGSAKKKKKHFRPNRIANVHRLICSLLASVMARTISNRIFGCSKISNIFFFQLWR